MKKYLLIITLFVLASLSLTAQAAGDITVDAKVAGTQITVSGMANPNEAVSVFVSKTERATVYKDIVYATEVMSNQDGRFSAVFNMPDKFDVNYNSDGTYTAYAGSATLGRAKDVYEYVSIATQNNLRIALNGKETYLLIKDLLLAPANKVALTSMGIEIDDYINNAVVQDNIAEILFSGKPYSTNEELKAKYDNAFVTALVNTATDTDALAQTLIDGAYVNFVVDGVDISVKPEILAPVMNYLIANKPFTDTEDVEQAIYDGYVVYKLDTSNKQTLTGVVKNFASHLGLVGNTYFNTYSNNTTMQIVVNEKTLLKFAASGITSHTAFAEEFKRQLSAYKPPAPPSGNEGVNSGVAVKPGATGVLGGGNNSGNIVGGGTTAPEQKTEVFSDMADFAWAKEAVEYLYDKGIVSGTSEDEFSPEDYITREQFIKMIVGLGNFAEKAELPFEDVDEKQWYYDFVSRAYASGIISGVSETAFGTGSHITREDTTVIIDRCIGLLGLNVNNVRDYSLFADESIISGYAKESVISLYKQGIISGMGDGSFGPKDKLTRAQAAKMIHELCKLKEK